MKLWNIVILTLLLAAVGSLGIGMALEKLLGPDSAALPSLICAIILGLNSRKIVEKVVGYTMLEVIEEIRKENEENKQ